MSDKVTGPYRHITWLKGAGCDSTLFGDADGKTYAIMPFGNEYIQEVDLRGIEKGDIKLVGERKMIVARDNSDVGKTTSPDYIEGPWMIKRNGKYILFTASPYRGPKRDEQQVAPQDLAQGYWVGAAVADNVWGPYKKQPQVFLGGHIAVFTGPDAKEWFSYRGEAGGKSQGRLCVDPIQFNGDGSIKPFMPSGLLNISRGQDDSVTVRQDGPMAAGNSFYVGNRAPLAPRPFVKLPPGAITPKGWLRHQLELDANGLTGRMPEISRYLKYQGNGWVDPKSNDGWEEMPYWLRGYGDLGYVLKDEKIVGTARQWIEGILANQRPGGYFGPMRLKTAEKGEPDLWSHMLVLDAFHSYYEFTGDERVLKFMLNYFKWQNAQSLQSYRVGWGALRWADNLAVLYWLYNKTDETWLLDLARKIHENSVNYTTGIPNWHNGNLAQGIREPAEYWMQSKEARFLQATELNYQKVMGTWGQFPGGGFAGDENIRKPYKDPRQGFETCGFAEFMHTFEMMTRISGDPQWADRCEDIAFNSFPAALTPDHKGVHYVTCANCIQLDKEKKGQQFDNKFPMQPYKPGLYDYRCCPHNYGMGWPYFAEELWLATADNGLCASLYAASEVKAKVADGTEVVLTEETDYPFQDTVNLRLSTPKSVRFPLYLRVPRWCEDAALKINGEPVAIKATPRAYIVIHREWKDGDTVALQLPMRIAVRSWAKNMNSASVDFGPLTFSLKIGEKWQRYGGTNDWPEYQVFSTSPWNYGLVFDPQNPATSFQIQRKPGPLSANPFTHDGAPISLRAQARRIPAWQADKDAVVGVLRQGPIRSQEPVETVTLIPMGAARLRITSFPVISNGPDGREWMEPPAPPKVTASFSGVDHPESLQQMEGPIASSDDSVPRFTWWPHEGSTEWVQYDFEKPITVASFSAYWFDDTGHGGCRVPKSWRILYRDVDGWRPVEPASGYDTARDRYNRVAFKAVTTSALRLEVQLQENVSGGVLAWTVSEK